MKLSCHSQTEKGEWAGGNCAIFLNIPTCNSRPSFPNCTLECNFVTFPGCRWVNGTCKLQRACTFAHGEKELEAWNEHLEKMEKQRKMKTEEGKDEKTRCGRPESSSNKVNYYDVQSRCYYDSIFVIGLRKSSVISFL